jgi:hypothetical protein
MTTKLRFEQSVNNPVLKNPTLIKRLQLDGYPKKISICPGCNEVNFKGIWYLPDSSIVDVIDVQRDDVHAQYCPACRMKTAGIFEGELNILQVPKHLRERVERIILQEVAALTAENPQHRLLSLWDYDDHYQLTTTTGPMVRRLGEKILNSFWTCDVESKYFSHPRFLQQVNATFKTAEYF